MGVKHIRADQISTEDGLVISGNVNLINGTFFTDGARFTGDWVKDENENVSREGKVGVSKDTVDNSENSANLQVSGDIDFTGDLYQNGVLFTAIIGSSPWSNLVGESNIYFTAGDVSIGTNNCNAKLHVDGNVYASSNLEVGSANLFVDTETSRIGVKTRSPAAILHVEGNVYASSNLEVGSANLFVDTETSRIGVKTRSPVATLHVEGNVYASSNLEVGSANLFVDTETSRIGVNTRSPAATLHVEGNVYVSSNLTASGNVVAGGFTGAGVSTTLNGTVVKRDASGNFTAGTITGNLTGDVTGNLTGDVTGDVTGDCSGNSGTTSDGTSANTASAIVRRDASGNFTAGTITGNLTGYCSGNSGTTSDGTSANTASAIVRRDASGNFTAGTITASGFAGAGVSTSATVNKVVKRDGSGDIYARDLYPSGKIGINTSSPLAKLHVNGSITSYLTQSTEVGLLGWDESTYRATSAYWDADQDLSIYATDEIATNGRFFSTQGAWSASDARIKRDIEDINDSEALTQLRQLQPKKYGYKNVGQRGTGKVIGFIADEVEEVIPEAITKTEWGIPSILEVSNVIGSNVISFTNFSTSNLDSNATSLECIDIFGEEHFITIAKVIDEKTIQVEEDLSNWTGSSDETGNLIAETTTTTLTPEEYEAVEPDELEGYVYEGDVYEKTITSYPGDNLFIRGERVSNFRTLKKEMLFAINFSATQELDRQLQVEKTRNDALEARILALEQKI